MDRSLWYNKFAPFYDIGTFGDWFYQRARVSAIDQLKPHEGARIVDIFCGTGTNFPILQRHIGASGHILAVDGSSGMLEQAQGRMDNMNRPQCNIELLKADFSTDLGVEKLCEKIRKNRPHHLLFTLGLTCLPNWQTFSAKVIKSAPPGARLCIMDVFSEKLTLGARFINWIGAADCQRQVWEELKRTTNSFELTKSKPFVVLDVSVIIASGAKNLDNQDAEIFD